MNAAYPDFYGRAVMFGNQVEIKLLHSSAQLEGLSTGNTQTGVYSALQNGTCTKFHILALNHDLASNSSVLCSRAIM